MKRQERAVQEGIGKTISTTTSRKKKGKPGVGKVKKEEVGEVIIEEKKRDNNNNYDREFAAEFFKADQEVVMVMDWDGWPCLLCAVVEQMSWGTCWSPFWDMEYLMGEASHAFYSDVVWEDNIWDLKDIKDFPTTLETGGLLEN